MQFLTTTGRSGSKRHLDQAVWVRPAPVFGFRVRLGQPGHVHHTQKDNVFNQMQAPPGKIYGQETLTFVAKGSTGCSPCRQRQELHPK